MGVWETGFLRTRSIFLITPFGHEERSEDERRVFEEVQRLQENVLDPVTKVLAARGIAVVIRDARAYPKPRDRRQIRDWTAQLIYDADAVIAVLTSDKPNAFVELGWAQAMWKRPILLRHDDFHPGVDLQSDLAIEYASRQIDKSDPAANERLVRELADDLETVLTGGYGGKPFRDLPDSLLAYGDVEIFSRFSKGVPTATWRQTILDAERELHIAAPKFARLFEQGFAEKKDASELRDDLEAQGAEHMSEFERLLIGKLLSKVSVTTYLYAEEAVSAPHFKPGADITTAARSARTSMKRLNTLRVKFPDQMRIVTLRDRYLPFRLTMTEREALVTLRLPNEQYNTMLSMRAPNPMKEDDPNAPSLYAQMREVLTLFEREDRGFPRDRPSSSQAGG